MVVLGIMSLFKICFDGFGFVYGLKVSCKFCANLKKFN